MSLSKLAARCRVCPFVDTCDHKEMEAYGLLPLPKSVEPTAQQTVTGYRHIENFWDNPKMPIAFGPGVWYPIMASDEIHIDVDKLVQVISREVQLPEHLLRGDY